MSTETKRARSNIVSKDAVNATPAIKVYQLKVTLRHITPQIYRRVQVTSDTTIAGLHAILQIVMGWEDLHLHQFRIHGKTYGIYRTGGMSFADDSHQVTLRDFKLRKGEKFVYEYDMGDFWQHDIRLEQVVSIEPEGKYPVCTEGDGDCPPEDCGGPSGFMELMEERSSWCAMSEYRSDILLVAKRLLEFYDGGPKPSYEEEEFIEALDRMERRLDDAPIEFNRREVNAALRRIAKMGKEPECTSESR